MRNISERLSAEVGSKKGYCKSNRKNACYALVFLQHLRHRGLNDSSVRQDHSEKQALDPAASGIRKADEPIRNGLFAEFRVLDTAKPQIVKRRHPIYCNPDRFLSGNGT